MSSRNLNIVAGGGSYYNTEYEWPICTLLQSVTSNLFVPHYHPQRPSNLLRSSALTCSLPRLHLCLLRHLCSLCGLALCCRHVRVTMFCTGLWQDEC